MSSYAKRRSTRPSVANAGSTSSKPGDDQPPRSPQFGGVEDNCSGAGSSATRGGGPGQYEEDADVALKADSANAAPRVSRSAFDERVRDVRDRLREMMANGGGHGEGSTAGSDIECDTPPHVAKKLPARGSKGGRASMSSLSTTTVPDDESVPSSSSTSTARTRAKPESSGGGASQATLTSGRRRSHSLLLDSDLQFEPDSNTSASAASRRTSAGRMPPPEISSDSPTTSQKIIDISGKPAIGRDVPARVGLRVRVVDPQIARCVEPIGIIKEVRCEGTRVRVEHDGTDNPQRYYNTGKNGEYQLVVESAPDEELAAAVNTKDVTPDSKLEQRAAKPRSRPSRGLPEPPQILDDEDELEEPESKAVAKAGPRRSRYSEIRSAKRMSKSLPSCSPEEVGPNTGAVSKSKAASHIVEQSSSPEPAPRRSAVGKPTTEFSPDDDVQSSASVPRAKNSAKKKSSKPTAAAEPALPASDAETPPMPKRYADRRSLVPSSAPERTPPAVASEPEAAPAPRRYSERRSLKAASSSLAAKSPPAPTSEPETPPTEPVQETAPKQKRYSEKRKSMRLAQASNVPTASETSEPEPAAFPPAEEKAKVPPKQQAPMHQAPGNSGNAGIAENAANVPEDSSRNANKLPQEASEVVYKLKEENEEFLGRLKNLEESLAKNLKAVKEDVHSQIGAAESKIVSRVLEELENRIRQGAISVAGQIAAGAMDGKTVSNKLKSVGQLDMDACSEPAPQGIGTPVNEEPEQELMAGGDMSDGSASTGRRRGSDASMTHTWDPSPQKCFQKPLAEVSNAELADNRQRLENIGNAARRVSASLGGGPLVTHNYVPESVPQFGDGLQTPDFAVGSAPSFQVQHEPLRYETPDNLDAEMEHLAEMRRFASSVLNHAGALTAGSHTQDHSVPPRSDQGGSMPPAWAERIGTPRTSLPRRSVGRPPESHLQAARRQSALREVARTDEHADHFNPPSRGFELHAQPPPQPPPASSMQQWTAGARSAGTAGARRSTSTPMRMPWSSTGGYEAEGDGGSGGRLVF